MRDYRLCLTQPEAERLLLIYGTLSEIFRCYISLSCILERKGMTDDAELSRNFFETSLQLKNKGKVDEHIWHGLSLVNRN